MGIRQRIIVIMDSNMLISISSGQIPPSLIDQALESSYVIGIPKAVVRELRHLSETAPIQKTRKLAKKALELLSSGRIQYTILEEKGYKDVDDEIVALALDYRDRGYRVIVATNDKGLRRRLKTHNIPTLYYRESESLLEADWLPP